MMRYEQNYKHSDITEKIIKEALHVHHVLGYGFLEKVYENTLVKRLKDANLNVKSQYQIQVYFEDQLIGDYIADILVEERVLSKLKQSKSFIQFMKYN